MLIHIDVHDGMSFKSVSETPTTRLDSGRAHDRKNPLRIRARTFGDFFVPSWVNAGIRALHAPFAYLREARLVGSEDLPPI